MFLNAAVNQKKSNNQPFSKKLLDITDDPILIPGDTTWGHNPRMKNTALKPLSKTSNFYKNAFLLEHRNHRKN